MAEQKNQNQLKIIKAFVSFLLLLPIYLNAQNFWSTVIDSQSYNLSHITDKALFRDSLIIVSGVISDASCPHHNLFAFNQQGQQLWQAAGTLDIITTDDNFIYTAGFTIVDDIIGFEQIIISKYDKNGKEIFKVGYPAVPHTGSYTFVPKSIEITGDGKILVGSEKSVVLSDINGAAITETSVKVRGAIHSVYSNNPASYFITTERLIYKSNSLFAISDSVSFADTVRETLVNSNTVYVLFDTRLIALDTCLNVVDTLISTTAKFDDIEIYGEKIWLSTLNADKIQLIQLAENVIIDTVSFPQMLNKTEYIVTDKSFAFTGNSFSNQIALCSFRKSSNDTYSAQLPDIEFIDFDISNITIEYHVYQGVSIATGYFFTPKLTVKNNGADTLKSLAAFADLHGGMNCAQNFFYQKFTSLKILPGQSQTLICQRTYEQEIKNNQLCFELLAPNAKAETNIATNAQCKTFTITGINNFKKPEIKVYPNPFTSFITIENPNLESIQAELLDSGGRIILQKQTKSEPIKIETSQMTPGLYFLKIISEKTNFSQPIIKQ